MGVPPLMSAPQTFVHCIGYPRDWPYLSAMGVSAQLEIDPRLLAFL